MDGHTARAVAAAGTAYAGGAGGVVGVATAGVGVPRRLGGGLYARCGWAYARQLDGLPGRVVHAVWAGQHRSHEPTRPAKSLERSIQP
jgi:hypothetical protein